MASTSTSDTKPHSINAFQNSTDSANGSVDSNGCGYPKDSTVNGQHSADNITKPAALQLFGQPTVDLNSLSWPSVGASSRANEDPESGEKRLEKMRGAIKTLLECMGEDPDREGLLATPGRHARALLFLTEGYQGKLDTVVNNALFHEGHHEMVVVKDIEIHSLCEHHLVPFTGKMHIGYIPSNTVIGLSKLPRIAEMFARRLQIQERLTKEVAYAIEHILTPRGVMVVMESSHLCMVMRGVEKSGSTTVTSSVLGEFGEVEKRSEFLRLVGLNK